MQYRTLGRTGIKVTPYALGAMMFASFGNPDARTRLDHPPGAGRRIDLVDTADRYGDSEEVVGKALRAAARRGAGHEIRRAGG